MTPKEQDLADYHAAIAANPESKAWLHFADFHKHQDKAREATHWPDGTPKATLERVLMVHNESTDAHMALASAQSRHAQQLQAAENLGYERGIKDYGKVVAERDEAVSKMMALNAEVGSLQQWKEAIIQACIVACIDYDETYPARALTQLLQWERATVLDPAVSERAQRLRDTYLAERDAALAQVAEIGRANGWQLFSSAPEDGREIIVWREDAGVFTAVFKASFVEGDAHDYPTGDECWFTASGEDLTGDLPALWMDFPTPPDQAAAGLA